MKPDHLLPVATGAVRPCGPRLSPAGPRLLAICNIDSMAWTLLLPWFTGLLERGYELHIACASSEYFARLAAQGFQMHAVSIRRTFWPWAHVLPFFQMWKLVRQGGFDVINTHSAVAAAPGRLAAWLSGCGTIVYTVHGFYFHDNMPAVPRSLFKAIEWLLGRLTGFFMFVSDEDRRTAIRTGIVPAKAKSITLLNGVDLEIFSPREMCAERARDFKHKLGIDHAVPVVGIIGRIVREKGYREFLEMARYVAGKRKAVFLVVGASLPSDRDQFGPVFRREVAKAGLESHFIFTGQTDQVAEYLRIMDIFVLPSYREGFPRSIVEAMSAGVPVVATDIRGCREAVVHGETGLIVPPKDGEALAHAVERLLANPEEAAGMGRAGRRHAVEHYDYLIVRQRFVDFIDNAYSANVKSVPARG